MAYWNGECDECGSHCLAEISPMYSLCAKCADPDWFDEEDENELQDH